VVLTLGNDTALTVSPPAEPFLDHSSPAVLKFSATYEGMVPDRDTTISSHPGEVAAAVNAQIQFLAPSLLAAGAHGWVTSVCTVFCVPSHRAPWHAKRTPPPPAQNGCKHMEGLQTVGRSHDRREACELAVLGDNRLCGWVWQVRW